MYGTIINGAFVPAPKTLTVDGMVHYRPSDAMYEAAGYLLRVDAERPEGNYAPHWEAAGGQAVQSWVEAEPIADELSRLDDIEAALMEIAAIIGGEE